MPPTPTAPAGPKPKPAGKGIGAKLGKKVGPFPLWVWLATAAGTVGLWWWLGRRSDGGGSVMELATGTEPIPQDMASAGAPSGNGVGGTMMDPAVLDQLNAQQGMIDMLGRNVQGLTGDFEYFSDATYRSVQQLQEAWDAAALYQATDDGYYDNGAEATVGATLGAPGTRPAPKQQNMVQWGGSLYGPGLGNLFIKEQLKPKGVNPQSWAKKHPAAASYLGISKAAPPKPKPKAAAKPAPVKKVAPKPVYKTYKKQVKLKPGQKLKFTKGKGYYAG